MTRWTVFWASAASYAVAVGVGWWLAPAQVPLHFGISGDADRWGSAASLGTTLIVLGVVMVAVFAGGAATMRRMPPALINLPRRQHEWWTAEPRRLDRLRRMVGQDLLLIGAVTFAFLSAVAGLVYLSAHREPAALGWGFAAALTTYLVGMSAVCWWMVSHRYRVPGSPGVSGE